LAADACLKAGVPMKAWQGKLMQGQVIVDALVGIGLKGEVKAPYDEIISEINATSLPVLSLDVPSGLNADTGYASLKTIRASKTVTFVGLKRGLLTADGVTYAGDVVLSDLQANGDVLKQLTPYGHRLSIDDFQNNLSPRLANTCKNDYGHLLVLGGYKGMSGSARLAATAALRVGTGLVSVGTHHKHAKLINITRPELMSHAIEKSRDLKELVDKASVIVVGPGLGQSKWGRYIWQDLRHVNKPLVVDADALNFLAKKPYHNKQWILTPHPGEAARLLNTTTQQVQANRFDAIEKIQQKYGGVCVLKGAGSLVLSDANMVECCPYGNPGMASAGMGDLLAGVIGGLVAQGLRLEVAASLGVCLHAKAGDLAAEEGERGLLASDLMPYLRWLVNVEN
jgi:ADP-dependent NAD(P)H-hydrate dehydratase / NAD(P)H-hydrate epimerase